MAAERAQQEIFVLLAGGPYCSNNELAGVLEIASSHIRACEGYSNMLVAFNKSHTATETEVFLQKLNDSSANSDLIVPTALHNWMLGGRAMVIQAITTWAKRNPEGRLVTYINTEAECPKQLQNLVAEDHGLVAVLQASDVVMRDGVTSIKDKALKLARDRLVAMQSGVEGAWRGNRVFLVCADQERTAFLPAFYHQTQDPHKDLRREAEFRSLASKILFQTGAQKGDRNLLFEGVESNIGSILFELFTNTHHWGRRRWDSALIERSVRGILFQYIYGTSESLGRQGGISGPLHDYLDHWEITGAGRQRFVEMSVFDSGVGLAQQFLRGALEPDDSLAKEHDAVLSCLRLHSTTSTLTHRGIGLDLVLHTLTKAKGFIHIRTGRLSLQRDFIRCPHESDPKPVLYDWSSGEERPVPNAPIEGTLVTVILPLFHRFRE